MKQRNIATTLECFVQRGGKYLMLHRSPDKRIMPDVWMAPGGHREFNEGLFEAAHRETREETGLEIKNLKIKATGNAYLKDLDSEFYFHFLTADLAGGKLKTNPKDGEFKWLTPAEIMKLPSLLAELKHVLPYVFGDPDRVVSYKAVYAAGNKLIHFELEDPD